MGGRGVGDILLSSIFSFKKVLPLSRFALAPLPSAAGAFARALGESFQARLHQAHPLLVPAAVEQIEQRFQHCAVRLYSATLDFSEEGGCTPRKLTHAC